MAAGPLRLAYLRRRLSALLALRGVLAVLFGVLALLWPGVTVLALALLFAAYAVVDGAGMVASGLSQDGGGRRWSYVLAGVVGIVAGVLAGLWPGITALALVVLAGAWAVATGVLEVYAAVRLRRELTGEWVLALLGVLSVVAGVVVLVRPDVGAVTLSTVLGAFALLSGAGLLAEAWRLRTPPGRPAATAGRPAADAPPGPGPGGLRADTTRATRPRPT